MGRTAGSEAPFAQLERGPEGAISADGLVLGTYCHGFFGSTGLRRAMLARIGAGSSGTDYAHGVDVALDDLAAALEQHIDIDALLALAR